MAIVNTPVTPVPTLEQCKLSFDWLKTLENLSKSNPELFNKIPKLADVKFQYESPLAALSLFNDHCKEVSKALDEEDGLDLWRARRESGVSDLTLMSNPEALRLVFEASFAESTTRRVEFEPRGELWELHAMDTLMVVEIEEPDAMPDSVQSAPYEHELGRDLFEQRLAAEVCAAIVSMTVDCIQDVAEPYRLPVMLILNDFVEVYSQGGETRMRAFRAIGMELSKANMMTRKERAEIDQAIKRGFVLATKSRDSHWLNPVTKRTMSRALEADTYRKQGYELGDACDMAQLSTSAYYRAMGQAAFPATPRR